ncbi:Uncharacterized protein TCM_020164 [Theobroma cacao]|uniref:Uncharacterized protein n=1 Tax=Theobroma cacao TaxID=3641 RepID=A0A061EJ64_THECC|nr:Uncharacterized protein TCM_020164 [Theobroma cacao]
MRSSGLSLGLRIPPSIRPWTAFDPLFSATKLGPYYGLIAAHRLQIQFALLHTPPNSVALPNFPDNHLFLICILEKLSGGEAGCSPVTRCSENTFSLQRDVYRKIVMTRNSHRARDNGCDVPIDTITWNVNRNPVRL